MPRFCFEEFILTDKRQPPMTKDMPSKVTVSGTSFQISQAKMPEKRMAV
jgi:hypothetical protein